MCHWQFSDQSIAFKEFMRKIKFYREEACRTPVPQGGPLECMHPRQGSLGSLLTAPAFAR